MAFVVIISSTANLGLILLSFSAGVHTKMAGFGALSVLLQCLLILWWAESFIATDKVITIGATLSSESMEEEFRKAVNGLNKNTNSTIRFDAFSIIMDGNPIRSALDLCDKLLAQRVYTVVASHPNSTQRSPISVSYTCGYYNIPVVGVTARDSAFSDVVSKHC
ncbi:glutamate [NMDA] receptor subunit 1 [Elysia marginata]|uniref:Glutamate [NMDA] receptor subunit 1 n=1 Tax=Elysia marginata TaxID=1093978 RepID=A0AAV4IUC8_9GAST|nr:glutamate [NMDA] receptor subunit 1 [Elysia marginata]